MKKWFKKITVTVLAVMMFSSLVSYVYASSQFEDFSIFTSGFTYTKATDLKRKSNASDVAVELHNSGIAGEYRVRTMGDGVYGQSPVNFTYYDNRSVNYVVCARDYLYSIDNTIYENGYRQAVIMICPLGGGGTTTGKWSPDTLQTFRTPESAG